MKLLDALVKHNVLTEEQRSSLEEESKKKEVPVEELILQKELVPEKELFQVKESVVDVPLRTVVPEEVPLKILELIPEDSVRHYKMIPIGKTDEDVLEIGMVYPEDLRAKEALSFLARQAGITHKVFLIMPSTFQGLLRQYHDLRTEVEKALETFETESEERDASKTREVPETIQRMAEEAPVAKMVGVIVRHAVEGKASDIHIEPARERTRVRFRFLGALYSSLFLPADVYPAIVARIKILSHLKIDETRVPQDGRFSFDFEGRTIDFRVSTLPTVRGEKVVIRILDPLTGLKKLDELGFSEHNHKIITQAIEKPYGMILSTGPTGSGKTTTLYALLQLLNKEDVNILTLEDPVEYILEGINQSQMRPEINYSFATGLRHALRQDPDIIMVGEIRDHETAALSIHATLTGHLMLSTLHTSNAVGAIPRFLDLGIKPYLLAPTISIIIAQRLVRTLCPHCKVKAKISPQMKEMILKEVEEVPEEKRGGVDIKKNVTAYEPKGCKQCNHGFVGRVAIAEVLEMTQELSEIILRDPSEGKVMEEAKRQGMITMRQDGILKVLRGETTLEEVFGAAEEKV